MTDHPAPKRPRHDRVRRVGPGSGTGAGRLVAVCGTGGTGASTLAIALAQSLARPSARPGPRPLAQRHRMSPHGALLVDTALDADQALFHGTADDAVSLADVVAAYHRGDPGASRVAAWTTEIRGRGYRFLPGLRSHVESVVLRSPDLLAALAGLRSTFEVVVADTDADAEVDENADRARPDGPTLLASSILASADSVLVVTVPGLKGLHALARCIQGLIDFGIAADTMIPVVNRAPRSPAVRAEFTSAFARLLPGVSHPPVFVPESAAIERAHRELSRAPDSLCSLLGTVIRRSLDHPRSLPCADEPTLFSTGTDGGAIARPAGR